MVAIIVFLLLVVAFNFERITGSAVKVENAVISLSTDGERFFDNPKGNAVTIDAGNLVYVKVMPANNNKRVFIYDQRSSSKAGTFETKCFKKEGSRCLSSIAIYKTPVDQWLDGVYTVKISRTSGKAEFTLQDSIYGG